MRSLVGPARQRREGEQVHDAIGEHVEQHGLVAAGRVAQQGVEEIARVRDRRVGDHPAEARLAHRGEIAPDDGHQRQKRDERRRAEARQRRPAKRRMPASSTAAFTIAAMYAVTGMLAPS